MKREKASSTLGLSVFQASDDTLKADNVELRIHDPPNRVGILHLLNTTLTKSSLG